MAFTHSDSIEVRRIESKGRGVFARRLIRKGELIERVPCSSCRTTSASTDPSEPFTTATLSVNASNASPADLVSSSGSPPPD